MFGKVAVLFRLLMLLLASAMAWLPATQPARAEGDGQAIMNWRLTMPRVDSSRQSAPAYRPRRRSDNVVRYQDDSALGLHMPAIRVEVPVVAAANAPSIVVIGDSLAEALVAGFDGDNNLRSAYRLVEQTRSASGLVRSDYHDWPKALATILQQNSDVSAVIIMVGLNDRQPLRIGEISHEPLSEPWREEYRKRVEALLAVARERRVPVLWVGLPLMRSPKLSADLMALSALQRERVSNFGQSFVETVDAFADATGAFSASGPDVIGDIVRLRGPDGIHFTPAGQRKLAFFVDRALRRLVGERTDPALASLPTAPSEPAFVPAAPTLAAPPALLSSPTNLGSPFMIPFQPPVIAPLRPAIGERLPLGEIRQAGSMIGAGPPRYGDPVNRNLFDRGIPPDARPGRSDDHGWR